MGGFSVVNSPPRFQDTGQGARGRLLSWAAWTADPSPLMGPEVTRILRTDDNGAMVDGDTPVALGTGGCGQWEAILDGFSNGATSGGDNCFFVDAPDNPPSDLINDAGVLNVDDLTWPADSGGAPGSLWSNGGVVNVIPGFVPTTPTVVIFGDVTAHQLLVMGAFGLTTAIPDVGSGQLYLVGEEIWVA